MFKIYKTDFLVGFQKVAGRTALSLIIHVSFLVINKISLYFSFVLSFCPNIFVFGLQQCSKMKKHAIEKHL